MDSSSKTTEGRIVSREETIEVHKTKCGGRIVLNYVDDSIVRGILMYVREFFREW